MASMLIAETEDNLFLCPKQMKSAIAEGCDSFNYATLKVRSIVHIPALPGNSGIAMLCSRNEVQSDVLLSMKI